MRRGSSHCAGAMTPRGKRALAPSLPTSRGATMPMYVSYVCVPNISSQALVCAMASIASSRPSVPATKGAPPSSQPANAFTSLVLGSNTSGIDATRDWLTGLRLPTSSRATARASACHAAAPTSGPSSGRVGAGVGAGAVGGAATGAVGGAAGPYGAWGGGGAGGPYGCGAAGGGYAPGGA